MFRLILFSFVLASSLFADADFKKQFLSKYCYDCHDSVEAEADVDFEKDFTNWNDPKTGFFWETVYYSLKDSYMPPAKKKKQPSKEERTKMLSILQEEMLSNLKPGGTTIRRLNRTEYRNTIRDIFKLDYELPESFPVDSRKYGFDNIGDGLQLSSTLMNQHFKVANEVVDELFPEIVQKEVKPKFICRPRPFMIWNSMSRITWGGAVHYQLRVEHSGYYEFVFDSTYFTTEKARLKPLEGNVIVELYAIPEDADMSGNIDALRLLDRYEFDPKDKLQIKKQYKLNKADRICFRWVNSPLTTKAGPPYESRYQKFGIDRNVLFELFEDELFQYAWDETVKNIWPNLKNLYPRMKAILDKGVIDKKPGHRKIPFRDYNVHRDFIRFFLRDEATNVGPKVNVMLKSIRGPVKQEQHDSVLKRLKAQKFLMKERNGLNDKEYADKIMSRLLGKLFRKSPSKSQVDYYTSIALRHIETGNSFKKGLALAIRSALVSPHFLYRSVKPGTLDQFALASRLSYFIWGTTPDYKLLRSAVKGELIRADVLEFQTRRMLLDSRSSYLVERFTGQWLGLDKLDFITPDERLIKDFSNNLRDDFKEETKMLFAEILKQNKPIEDFIDPDFTYLSQESVKKIYKTQHKVGVDVERVSIKRGGRIGGILTQGSVMMATANGVDTQPILRGVWLVENIFGIHLPSPPSSVPALQEKKRADNKRQSVREIVKEHTENPNCYSCHKNIDPLGFVLENFDPVGRWRDTYEDHGIKNKKNWLKVEPESTMPDGEKLNHISKLKKYLVKNIDMFSGCMSEKLMTFATGRKLNFLDKKIIRDTVKKVKKKGNGFQDLVVELVKTEAFRNK